jgi:hypothetical protein
MKAKPEILGVEYSPAKGGVVSHTNTRVKRPGQGGGGDFDHKSVTTIHPTLKHAQDHMAGVMGKFFASKDTAEAPEEKGE